MFFLFKGLTLVKHPEFQVLIHTHARTAYVLSSAHTRHVEQIRENKTRRARKASIYEVDGKICAGFNPLGCWAFFV